MVAEVLSALPGALARGALTALMIGALLLLAQRLGRSAAGLFAGLPTVTGPAMLWLALDLGTPFAVTAALGAVAAGIACALFALGYGLASRRQGPAAALGVALASSALPLPWLPLAPWSLGAWLTLATAVCLACQGALGVLVEGERVAARSAPWRAATPPSGSARAVHPTRGWLVTAVVSGLVSALAAALAGAVGPFWAGMLTSPPLLAAAVALEQHRRPGGAAGALGFLHGYTAGLVGRGLFVAALGALLVPAGTAGAFVAALALSLVVGWVSSARLAKRPATISVGREERA